MPGGAAAHVGLSSAQLPFWPGGDRRAGPGDDGAAGHAGAPRADSRGHDAGLERGRDRGAGRGGGDGPVGGAGRVRAGFADRDRREHCGALGAGRNGRGPAAAGAAADRRRVPGAGGLPDGPVGPGADDRVPARAQCARDNPEDEHPVGDLGPGGEHESFRVSVVIATAHSARRLLAPHTVSSTGSLIRLRNGRIPAASTPPTAAPPAARIANCPAPCSSAPPAVVRPAVPAIANETAIWNSTRLVASLNRLSACTSAWTFGGSESRRPSALTATGSVLASTDPSTNAMLAGIPATAPATAAAAAADASTRPTARTSTGRHTASRSRHGSSSLAAYNSGGSTIRLTTSGGTWTAGNLGSRATTSPAITSRDGAGTRSRPAKAATTVPSTTRNKMVSTARTPPTFPSRPRRKSADQTSRRAATSLSATRQGRLAYRRSAVFGVVEVVTAARVPAGTLVAVGRDAAGVLEHPGQVQHVPGHERGVAVGEVVLRAAGAGIQVGGSRPGLADPSGVGLRRDGVSQVLQAVQDVHGAVLDAVLVPGDVAAADPAVVGVLPGVVEQVRAGVEPLDDPLGDRAVVAEPDRARDHQDVRVQDLGVQRRPGVRGRAMLGHVRPHPGRDVMVDGPDRLHPDAVFAHDRGAQVHQSLGVTELR